MGREHGELNRAIGELLDSVRPVINRVLWRHRIPAQDADDLVQQTLLSLVRRYDSLENPEAWLVAGIKYECLMYWRRRRRRLYHLVDDAFLESLSGPEEPSERLHRSRDLRRLLPRLPRRCRSLLKLRYGLGLEPGEVADKMGYQPSSIAKITRRCLVALSRELVAGGYGEQRAHA